MNLIHLCISRTIPARIPAAMLPEYDNNSRLTKGPGGGESEEV